MFNFIFDYIRASNIIHVERECGLEKHVEGLTSINQDVSSIYVLFKSSMTSWSFLLHNNYARCTSGNFNTLNRIM